MLGIKESSNTITKITEERDNLEDTGQETSSKEINSASNNNNNNSNNNNNDNNNNTNNSNNNNNTQVISICNDLSKQLQQILNTPYVGDDETLIPGFLLFAHTKLNSLIVADDYKDCVALLEFSWKFIHSLIFKKYYSIKKQILNKYNITDNKLRDNVQCIVELRKLSSRFNKCFKMIHKFYYNNLEKIVLNSYDNIVQIIPEKLLKENLNIKNTLVETTTKSTGSVLLVSVATSVYHCLASLGQCQRYMALMESINYKIEDFKKSLKYLNLAELILPSVGDTFIIKSKIYMCCDCYGYSVYCLLRASLSRIPSEVAQQNLLNLLEERSNEDFKKMLDKMDKMNKNKKNKMIINKEIIENYFLYCWAIVLTNKDHDFDNDEICQFRLNIFLEKIAARYKKNIEPIYVNLLILIGGFELFVKGKKKINLSDIDTHQLSYLNFAFRYIVYILNVVISQEWNNFHQGYQYLAFLRIVNCWLKSNKLVLQYAHRNEDFNKTFSTILNMIIKSNKSTIELTHRPKRQYYFREDVELREFQPINFAMSDFNDSGLVNYKDSNKRFMGLVDDIEDLHNSDNDSNNVSSKEDSMTTNASNNNKFHYNLEEQEGKLRIMAIVYSGKRIIDGNFVNIKFENGKYVYINKDNERSDTKKNKKQNFEEKKLPKNNMKPLSRPTLDSAKNVKMNRKPEKEFKIFNNNNNNISGNRNRTSKDKPDTWGYSGPSFASKAPLNFQTKPTTIDISSHLIGDGSNNNFGSTYMGSDINTNNIIPNMNKEEIEQEVNNDYKHLNEALNNVFNKNISYTNDDDNNTNNTTTTTTTNNNNTTTTTTTTNNNNSNNHDDESGVKREQLTSPMSSNTTHLYGKKHSMWTLNGMDEFSSNSINGNHDKGNGDVNENDINNNKLDIDDNNKNSHLMNVSVNSNNNNNNNNNSDTPVSLETKLLSNGMLTTIYSAANQNVINNNSIKNLYHENSIDTRDGVIVNNGTSNSSPEMLWYRAQESTQPSIKDQYLQSNISPPHEVLHQQQQVKTQNQNQKIFYSQYEPESSKQQQHYLTNNIPSGKFATNLSSTSSSVTSNLNMSSPLMDNGTCINAVYNGHNMGVPNTNNGSHNITNNVHELFYHLNNNTNVASSSAINNSNKTTSSRTSSNIDNNTGVNYDVNSNLGNINPSSITQNNMLNTYNNNSTGNNANSSIADYSDGSCNTNYNCLNFYTEHDNSKFL
ncbi:uncharacterized protein SCODWIG_00066 [Saccharomycodes ludwigii]|uniref:Uncharacterized protein n=1 Tax=Saccharomycodes ludwigii TaxID=36035 RepID=A0A376B0U4_9ASCO|nr:hypothetical protein SCDLUD_001885 [Saccharomycodes ludwigii]KAH3902074.1 hypothetical protein SCDLUD_001885 [Saccharomycodes ludwigii]SSD58305.1 uncharacterized protein SCODWIG_00066 [Saccharomycodes ludwigii]